MDRFTSYLEEHAAEAGEVAWLAGLAMIERATFDARERRGSRWRVHPSGELRRLRRDVETGLRLCELAAAFQDDENERERRLDADLKARAASTARAVRAAQTAEAQRVRLVRSQARREGREPTDEELHPWLAEP